MIVFIESAEPSYAKDSSLAGITYTLKGWTINYIIMLSDGTELKGSIYNPSAALNVQEMTKLIENHIKSLLKDE
jgi:hypothetical protein